MIICDNLCDNVSTCSDQNMLIQYIHVYIYIYIYIYKSWIILLKNEYISESKSVQRKLVWLPSFFFCLIDVLAMNTYDTIYKYVCACVCIYIYIYTYIFTYIHAYIHTHISIHYACAPTLSCIISTRMCACVCVYIYIYIYIYIHVCVYIYTHMRTCIDIFHPLHMRTNSLMH